MIPQRDRIPHNANRATVPLSGRHVNSENGVCKNYVARAFTGYIVLGTNARVIRPIAPYYLFLYGGYSRIQT